eukprot:TRINITY_DN1911_c0_g1_i17.p1 TRINITY_DN1911_c0_g1~~TRINITY_DN1911_c0_g1_i17.p1  ORF type:complete len:166 (+),score=9.73 TRINITY_DN1911_c0_g1_i17:87-584(+)
MCIRDSPNCMQKSSIPQFGFFFQRKFEGKYDPMKKTDQEILTVIKKSKVDLQGITFENNLSATYQLQIMNVIRVLSKSPILSASTKLRPILTRSQIKSCKGHCSTTYAKDKTLIVVTRRLDHLDSYEIFIVMEVMKFPRFCMIDTSLYNRNFSLPSYLRTKATSK